MNYNLDIICRLCLVEGATMPIFKINISKKIMAICSIQVWKNDGLPSLICRKCAARLHASFTFKKQCEKSDAKLREYLLSLKNAKDKDKSNNNNNNSSQNVSNEKIDGSKSYFPQSFPESNLEINCTSEINSQCRFPSDGNQLDSQIISNHIEPWNYNQIEQNNTTTFCTQNLNSITSTSQIDKTKLNNNESSTNSEELDNSKNQKPENTSKLNNTNVNCNEKKNETKSKSEKKDSAFSCNVCGKSFDIEKKMLRHKKIHTGESKYKCEFCAKSFSHRGNYKIHLRIHTGERPYKCSYCDKACRQSQDLEKHLRTHTGEKPHKCCLCTRAFSTSSNLIAHVRTHTGEKPYICTVCQKGFCQSNELTKHIRTHTGEKSHHCKICQRDFNGSSSLIVHMRTHTGEKPYTCSQCEKSFAQSNCLTVHLRKHERDQLKKKKADEIKKEKPQKEKKSEKSKNKKEKKVDGGKKDCENTPKQVTIQFLNDENEKNNEKDKTPVVFENKEAYILEVKLFNVYNGQASFDAQNNPNIFEEEPTQTFQTHSQETFENGNCLEHLKLDTQKTNTNLTNSDLLRQNTNFLIENLTLDDKKLNSQNELYNQNFKTIEFPKKQTETIIFLGDNNSQKRNDLYLNENLKTNNDSIGDPNNFNDYLLKKTNDMLTSTPPIYKCSQCNYKFYLNDELINHIKISHSQEKNAYY